MIYEKLSLLAGGALIALGITLGHAALTPAPARMNVAPRDIRVHPIGSDFDAPRGGVGEPGVPPIAPALSGSEMMRIVLATMAAGAPKALAAEAGR